MRILVIPKNLEVGGTQVNAIDTAVGLHRRGHDVIVAAVKGPLATRADDAGIRRVDLPATSERWARVREIRRTIADSRPDVVHAYEVRSILEAALGGLATGRPPVLGSILSTRVPWFLPESIPVTVGMPNLAEFTRRWRSGRTSLVAPPVPAFDQNASLGPVPGLDGGEVLVVLVSRLVEPFKREGILRTIAAMRTLGKEGHRLAIVGDGPARPQFERAAADVNALLGARVVAFTGLLVDAGPAFASADVVVGSGTSVMRGVLGGRPAVVLGREGFSGRVTPLRLEELVRTGFYGVGDGVRCPDPLIQQLRDAAAMAGAPELAAMAIELDRRFGVDAVVERFEDELLRVAGAQGPSAAELGRALARNVHYRLQRRRLVAEAARLGLTAEIASNHVYGGLRNMALPPARRWTGRNRRQEPRRRPVHPPVA